MVQIRSSNGLAVVLLVGIRKSASPFSGDGSRSRRPWLHLVSERRRTVTDEAAPGGREPGGSASGHAEGESEPVAEEESPLRDDAGRC
jgi:hypothetical protein